MVQRASRKKIIRVLLVVFAIIAAGGIGFFVGTKNIPQTAASNTQSVRENDVTYKFIHPLLAVERSNLETPSSGYSALQKSVQNYINSEKATGQLLDASVYFTDYKQGGGSFALNENDPYAPASMLKVVIMIGYLKESDSDPSILSDMYVYNSSLADNLEDIPFESTSTLIIGQSYSVNDLIHSMIINSDNGAMNVLLAHIDDSYLSQVYTELGLSGPTGDGATYTISAKDYSLFFRILYNATYLSKQSSELALSLLSQATFANGLVAGVPPGTVVAHKFGEHVNGDLDHVDSIELHDCGYIYASDAPYLLCVMTKSKTLDESEKVISNISKIIYNGR